MSITAARLQVDVIANTSKAEQGVTAFGNKLNSAAKNMRNIGMGMTAGITAPLLGIAAAGLNSAMQFEQNMNILQQAVGATAGEMSALQAQALSLGATTVFSAGEAASAMVELGKAGMGTEDIMASIGGVMDLAAAGGIELATAAGIVATTLNAFGLEASESARVANLFAAAANASSADIADLAKGVQNAGFAFSAAKWPVEDLVASLAILTNVGLTGSDASTALKNAVMQMISPTQQAADLAKELGISFFDAQGSMLSLPTIIDNLNAAFVGMTDQQRNAALATMFMSDGMKAMIPLLDQGSAGFNTMVTTVSAAGAATDAAGARMKGLSGGIEYLKGSVDSFLIGAALPFLDTLAGLARGAGDALTSFGALPQPIINATLAFAGVAAAAGPLLVVLGMLAPAFSLLAGPIGVVVAATAVMAAAWAADLGGIQGITATALGSVKTWFASTAIAAQELANGIATAFGNTKFPSLDALWQQFQAGDFQTVANTIRQTAYELMVNLDAELNITAQANQLKAQLVAAVNTLGSAVSNLDFSGAQANLSGMRDGILDGISTAIEGVDWGQGGSTFTGMINSLTTSINELDFSGIDWAGVFQRILLGPAGVALGAIQWVIGSESFAGLQTAVKGAIGTIDWAGLGTSFVGLAAAIGTQLSAVFADMGSDVTLAMPKIDIPWEQLTINTVGLINSVAQSIRNISWEGVGAGLVTGLVAAVVGTIGAISWAAEMSTTLKAQAIGMAANIGLEVGTALRGINIFEALTGLQASITGAFIRVVSGALTQIGSSLSFMLDLPQLAWVDYIELLSWVDYVSSLSWSGFVESLSWENFVAALSWASFVFSLNWGSFVFSLSWSSFVPDISWSSFVPDMGWGDFIPSLDWSRFIPWLGALGGGAATKATGTDFFKGGLSWVGERGPELVGLPRGSRIYDNNESMAMAGASGVTINVYIDNMGSDMDIHSAAAKLAREFQRRIR